MGVPSASVLLLNTVLPYQVMSVVAPIVPFLGYCSLEGKQRRSAREREDKRKGKRENDSIHKENQHSRNRHPVRAHREIQHAMCMPRQRGDHVECRVFPDAYLVLGRRGREAVRRDQLVGG